MKKYVFSLFVYCPAILFLCGCASTGDLVGSPLQLGERSLAKQIENDPFPTASQVGLAQK